MAKTKVLVVRISEDQDRLLKIKARSAGFLKKSDYVRCVLFKPTLLKVNEHE